MPAPMVFPLPFDAASARALRQNSAPGAQLVYDVLSRGAECQSQMNANSAAQSAIRTIQFREVTYSVNRSGNNPLVKNISFGVAAGETLVLLGRSGSGKTTLLKLINRLLLPTTGEVLVRGRATS